MKTLWRPMATLFVALSLLTGVLYPLLITGIGRAAFARQAAGSLIYRDGQPIGSALIGQNFDQPGYFWGRLSATAPMPYNGDASGGSNEGPLNPALVAAAQARIAALRAADPGNTAPVPVDLVTASGSGLDPQISPAAADYQAARVARARRLPLSEVQALIRRYTAGRQLGILGEPTVNVLALNLALDALSAKPAG
ncbi:potassium-transporting ATPase subunit KdpC [Pandoraea sp.]|uniref:potassium-transporting ATPase subunit KdpC n=1 Tax=Pandoraea sp. TaxID=1883445 RepID=UPI001201F13C|nr:potassium-transporting ATPase subunit KdpC [Pandoraea sp.]TAL56348.1 MAG: potassium-transporting ATPase subunit KdpC [Pandoraea sp.]TAM19990.1 MAG: potassium-transporting ATPase subunit KdpC [Pandoraea sp.]